VLDFENQPLYDDTLAGLDQAGQELFIASHHSKASGGLLSCARHCTDDTQKVHDHNSIRTSNLGVLMSRRRRVRAAHGRAREAKTHLSVLHDEQTRLELTG